MLDLATVKQLAPKAQRTLISQDFVDKLNAAIDDPVILEAYKDNAISYMHVLSTGKYKMDDYLSAVKYVTFKLMGHSNLKAYAKTFPDRYGRLINEGKSDDDIAPYVSMYNGNKLVTQIYEQTVIPIHILNAPERQKAINVLASIMVNDKVKGLIRVKAAEALLANTKPPENTNVTLNIGGNQSDAIGELREATERLAEIQRELLNKGKITLSELAESRIIDVEALDNDE